MKTICIVHYNTPELTEKAILSVRKWCLEDIRVIVFDNSDARPFKRRLDKTTFGTVKVIDNTKGKVINFEKELEKYPDKEWDIARLSNWGSMKHMLSVQKLWEMVPEGFVLMDSDVLIRKDISFLWNEEYAAVGKAQWLKSKGMFQPDRLMPYLLYMNVPKLVENGARFFDPERSWGLQKGLKNINNYYDTGACLFEDIRNTKPQLVALLYNNLEDWFFHYGEASWRRNSVDDQLQWLERHKECWEPWQKQDAKIYICTHRDFKPQVFNSGVYEIADARDYGDDVAPNGLRGSFYSEILTYQRLAAKKTLPKMIGFCGWRKYWRFRDQVPDLEKAGCIVSENLNLGMTMRKHYDSFSNVEDLDLCTQIIDEQHKEFSEAWHKAIDSRLLHPFSMFVMPSKDFREMMKLVSSVLDEFVKRAGDIDKRVSNADKYHQLKHPEEAYRIGGNLGERMISAWIDWKMPDAKQVQVDVTAQKW